MSGVEKLKRQNLLNLDTLLKIHEKFCNWIIGNMRETKYNIGTFAISFHSNYPRYDNYVSDRNWLSPLEDVGK